MSDDQLEDLKIWALVNDIERAAWARKWTALKLARKALEQHLGKRPHFQPFQSLEEQPSQSQ